MDTLLEELNTAELWTFNEIDGGEQRLLLASTASRALLNAKKFYPEQDSLINITLERMATFAASVDNFPIWKKRKSWDDQAFFLAHAGAILGHFQIGTGKTKHAGEIGWVGNHFSTRMVRAKYKHLPSRPDELFFRPADNAAALYALRLYDELNETGQFSTTYKEWSTYLKSELYYEESRLPCAAFSSTNTCQLEPSAAATGLFIAYNAAAQDTVISDIPYREWLHYFKGPINTPFTLNIKEDMRKDEQTRFCDLGAHPMKCGSYEEAIGLWAAAEYGGGYTYFRLFAGVLFQHWLGNPVDYSSMRPTRRVRALQEVAFRAMGETL